jgi:hypothetical protein
MIHISNENHWKCKAIKMFWYLLLNTHYWSKVIKFYAFISIVEFFIGFQEDIF